MSSRAVGDRIFSNYDFLKKISRTSSQRKRSRLLRGATDDELLSIVEAAANVLKGRFPLTKRQLNKLIPNASGVRKLSRARTPKGARSAIQHGGGSLLPSLLLPILIEAGRYLINRD